VEIYVLQGQAYALLGEYRPGETSESEVLLGFSIAINDICTQANIR
jgi:Uma2 family endonuclease